MFAQRSLNVDIGTLLLMLGLSYGLGVFWYDLLPGTLPEQVWRAAAYPFLGIFVAETFVPQVLTFDPKFGGISLITAFVGALVGVVVDWVITKARHPAMVSELEPRATERRAA